MLHIVTYDLTVPGKPYSSLISAIQTFDHIHISGSCWVIRSDLPATQIRNFLALSVDPSDNIFVCDFHNWAGCNLSREVRTWLKR